MINAGFGFGLMGHEVDIYSGTFDNKKNVFKNVSLSSTWNTGKWYDLLVTFNPPNGGIEPKNYSNMFYLRHGETPDKFQ